jgi:YcxB-like protein
MTHKFSYQLIEPDYIAANRLNFWVWVKSKKALRFIAIVGVIYAGLGAAFAFSDGMSLSAANIVKIVGIALLASIGVLTICSALGYAYLPRRTRKLMVQQKAHHLPIDYQIDADALAWKSELTDTRLPYNIAHKWAENGDIFLVYHSDMTFNVIAKGAAGKQAIDDLRDGLKKAGIKGSSL